MILPVSILSVHGLVSMRSEILHVSKMVGDYYVELDCERCVISISGSQAVHDIYIPFPHSAAGISFGKRVFNAFETGIVRVDDDDKGI